MSGVGVSSGAVNAAAAPDAWTAAMLRGEWAAAWAVSDAVLAARDPAGRDDPRLPYHQRWVWDGRAFDGRHVLVRCYHGLGDTLQFARFLPALRARAGSVCVEVQAELIGLLDAADRLVAFDPAAPLPPSECDIEIMELAHALRLAPDAVPPARLRVAGPALPGTIGVCWQAGSWDAARSVPVAALAAAVGARAVASLQPGGEWPGRVVRRCPAQVAATAALVAGLDLVVTVDTMVAHLAGTLGRPTWLMLRHTADWRWLAGRPDSPWYPSMRLFRQHVAGEWGAVLAAVAEALAQASSAAPRQTRA